jgi:putative nucleotidyltransferase with HDIG domain
VFHDVTERKLAEAALARVNRALRTLSAGNTALVHATDEQELTEQMCRILVEIGGYRLALVGYAEPDERRPVRTIAHCVQGNGYVERETVSWADDAAGQGPSGTAIRTARPQIVQDAMTDPAYAPWRDHAIRLGYAAVACFPLLDAEQSVFGVLCIYAAERGSFTQEESDLLAEFAGDLAFGIGSIRVQLAHANSAALLTRSMEGTIQAMAATVESRDAYTAGHQRRVAELVLAMAGEMHLAENDIHAVHLAAIVHDLGKIQVPAEILSKPGKLLPLEFELIKYHPTSGYNILKDVDFPWPIAEIVYQHHERLDGSGYPRGLKGDEILLAAKILAVADTVEAMSSHRPYRAALGIDSALAEIERGRGSVYDAAAVDTCLKLFREKRFAFST